MVLNVVCKVESMQKFSILMITKILLCHNVRSRSHSPSHGSRYGSETRDDRSRKGFSTCIRDVSGSKDCSESSNWEKAIGSQTVNRRFSPKKESNTWDPWVAACNQTNRKRKSMSSGCELWGEHSCDIKPRHGSSQSGRYLTCISTKIYKMLANLNSY